MFGRKSSTGWVLASLLSLAPCAAAARPTGAHKVRTGERMEVAGR